MYNEDAKNKFIEIQGKVGGVYKPLFASTEEMENEIGKDVAEFSKDESIEVVTRMKYNQFESVNTAITRLKRYKKWYAKTYNKDFMYKDIEFYPKDLDLSATFREQLIFKVSDIIIPDKAKPENGNPMMPAIVLTFYGLSMDEIVDLNRSDVKLTETMAIISYGKKKIEIVEPYDVHILRTFDQFTTGYTERGAATERLTTENKFMFKTSRIGMKTYNAGSPWTTGSIAVSISRCRDKMNDAAMVEKTQISSVRASGLYRRMADLLMTNQEIEFKEAVPETKSGREGKGLRKLNSELLRHDIRDYMKAFEVEFKNEFGDKDGTLYAHAFEIVSE